MAVFEAVAALPDGDGRAGDTVARALHAAVRLQRDQAAGDLASAWAPFVHLGR
ncbi:hypothetical protein ACFV2Q_04495 [Streptomyces sp. NPDC059650]|uniref:hypothetical protein n=1 Tax=Streptomyces sp. NPDC059650 TaxID=3346896 RepID=UPI00367924AA